MRLALLLLMLLGSLASSRADAPRITPALRAATPRGTAPLRAFGGRIEAPVGAAAAGTAGAIAGLERLDAALAGILAHAQAVRPASAVADLRALNPAMRFKAGAPATGPLVLVDAVTRGDPDALRTALERLGLEHAAVYANDVGGWLPVAQLPAALVQPELHALRAAMMRARAGAVSSQGDFASGAAALRTERADISGAGIRIGVLSDSFNCYAQYEQPGSGVPASGPNGYASNGFEIDASQDQRTGDLPATVTVLEEGDCQSFGAPLFLPFTDEGRAMLQIVLDVAPGAPLYFHSAANSEADFAAGIGQLAAAGARIEVDDVGYFDEPFFQDGIVAQAIDTVESQGVGYFSAAGNEGLVSYDNAAPSFRTISRSAPNAGEILLDFDTTGATNATALAVAVPALYPGEFVALVLEWDQPYVTGAAHSGGATSQLDLCVTGAGAADPVILGLDGNPVTCTGLNARGVDPVQVLIIGNPANATSDSAPETVNVMVGLAAGSAAPGRLKLALDGDGAPLVIQAPFAVDGPTLQGHPAALGAMAVGAAFFPYTPRCGVAPAILESYSSRGGEPILFDAAGRRLSAPEQRSKPDVVGPDGVSTTFFGETLASIGVTDASKVIQCADPPSYPNFFGTSAAAPHVAAAAALLLQADPQLTPAGLYQALEQGATPMGGTIPNDDTGYGFVRADQSLALLPATAGAAGSHGGGAFDLGWLALLTILAVARSRSATGAPPTPRPRP